MVDNASAKEQRVSVHVGKACHFACIPNMHRCESHMDNDCTVYFVYYESLCL